MKILIVHTDEALRARVAEATRELTNFVIVGSVDSAEAACTELASRAPDVVVLGGLDESSARGVIAASRTFDPTPAILVLAGAQAEGALDLADRVICERAPDDELQRALLAVTIGRRRPRREVAIERLALLGRLVAGVAHDVNNYLMVVDTSLALLQRDHPDADLAQPRSAIDSATRLLSTVMQHARGGAPAPERIDVAASVRRVLDLFGRSVPDDVSVAVDLGTDLPAVSAVPIEIEQILLNLVLNACEAMRGGGELRLAAYVDEGGDVCLEVADTGAGLALVAPREGVSPSSKGGGLGLGIVQSVVNRHGGSIRAVPRAGGGSRVIVSLPAVRSTMASTRSDPGSAGRAP